MEKFYITPDITGYPGIVVKKETEEKFENENVLQTLKDLTLITKKTEKGEGYDTTSVIHVYLSEGDILLFDEKNGYIKPAIQMQTAKEISDDFKALA